MKPIYEPRGKAKEYGDYAINIYTGYYGEGGVWRDKYFRQYADSREGVDANDVLCWMWQHDLPKPPKGE